MYGITRTPVQMTGVISHNLILSMNGAKRLFLTMHGLVEYLGLAAAKSMHSKNRSMPIGLD
jgi:hypothetical protein